MIKIPLIDMAPALNGGPEGRQKVADEIGQACRETGFFTIKGHGINKQMITDAYECLERFFALPLEDKNNCRTDDHLCGHQRNGYSALQEENANALMGNPNMPGDLVEKFSMGVWILDDNKTLPFNLADQQLADSLRQHMKNYYTACLELSDLLAELFAIAANLPEDFFVTKINNSYDFLRFHGYPATAEAADTNEGLAAHVDGSLLTLLTDTCGGLEVQTREGDWVVAETSELDHFIVNIGELMKRWTNDAWVSTMHRALLVDKKRRSMAFFKVVNDDTLIETIPGFCTDGSPKYEPVVFSDYMIEGTKVLYGEEKAKTY